MTIIGAVNSLSILLFVFQQPGRLRNPDISLYLIIGKGAYCHNGYMIILCCSLFLIHNPKAHCGGYSVFGSLDVSLIKALSYDGPVATNHLEFSIWFQIRASLRLKRSPSAAMANSQRPHAILFDADENGPGSVLIRSINHGSQGQTSSVRSLADGHVYIRKVLVKRVDQPKTEELMFCGRIPAHMAPRVVQSFDADTVTPTLVYSFCNGGDLRDFIQKCRRAEKRVPMAVFWHVQKQLLEILAFIHSGWQNGIGTQPDWEPITHYDIHEGNVFLHWPENTNDPFPQIMLGDWGLSWLVKDTKSTRKAKWRMLQGLELKRFEEVLFELNYHRPPGVRMEDSPIWLFKELWKEGTALEMRNPGMGIAKYIAEKFIVRADVKIPELQAEEYHDFRWTKPDSIQGFMVFGGNGKTPAEALKEAGFVGKNKIRQPWQWVDVADLPDVLFKGMKLEAKTDTKSDRVPVVAAPKKRKAGEVKAEEAVSSRRAARLRQRME